MFTKDSIMLKRRWTTGNRSSVDEGSLAGGEDETTIVEPEQGNGKDGPTA